MGEKLAVLDAPILIGHCPVCGGSMQYVPHNESWICPQDDPLKKYKHGRGPVPNPQVIFYPHPNADTWTCGWMLPPMTYEQALKSVQDEGTKTGRSSHIWQHDGHWHRAVVWDYGEAQ